MDKKPVKPQIAIKTTAQPFAYPLKQLMMELEAREADGKRELLGYGFSDFKEMNSLISGFRKGNISLILGSKNRLKSSLLLSIACSIIKDKKVPVLYYNFNTPIMDLLYNASSWSSNLPLDTLKKAKIMGNSTRKNAFQKSLDEFSKFQNYLHLVAGSQISTPLLIENEIKILKQKYKSKNFVLIIDGLQSMPSNEAISSKILKIESVVNSLKSIALSQNIPVIVGAAITKDAIEIDEKEDNERIKLSDCRNCPDIEDLIDFGFVMSKNWTNSNELNNQLSQKAENIQKDKDYIPDMEVIDLHLDTCPVDIEEEQSVQFMVHRLNGRFYELGMAFEQELQNFNRIDKLVTEIIVREEIEFLDIDPNRKPKKKKLESNKQNTQNNQMSGMGDMGMMAGMMPGMAPKQSQQVSQPKKEKVKVSLKLGS
ncbi:MAG: hypothetical protein COB02_04005 [Candidatus Cloacimonadota bacterium]|nr:MAG: hypothetical protein COB02_04005 [Candidatus Cloacimonadota bacterium]